MWTGIAGQGSATSSYEHGNEASGFIRWQEVCSSAEGL
jgi:hypothetical protein